MQSLDFHDRRLDPPDATSMTICCVCHEYHDISDLDEFGPGFICRHCLPDVKLNCDECGEAVQAKEINREKRMFYVRQVCARCKKEME
jgi:hypothetical protein